MHVAFTMEQQQLREGFRRVMAQACTPEVVRSAWNGESTDALWSAVVEFGALGIAAPEECDGLDFGLLDAITIYEEAGAAALPGPLVETAAVAVPLLAEAGREDLVRGLASGDARIAVVTDDGTALDAHGAQWLLARRGDGAFLVDMESAAVSPLESVDHARRLFAVKWTQGESLSVSAERVQAAWDRGVVATAAQLLGLGRRMLDTTVEYVKTREQFGKPIGSYQAVQHPLANALVDLDFAGPLIHRAAWSLDQESPRASVHASMAKAFASDAAVKMAKAALQCHGAMGYSFEYDLHLWMKRAWCLARSWGDAPTHRARVADFLSLPGATEIETH